MATAEIAVDKRVSWSAARIGGIAGLGFAAGVILQNAVLMSGSPLPGSGLDDVTRFYTENSGRVMIASGWVAINAVFFLTFLAVVSNHLRQSAETALWGRVGFAAGIALLPIFTTAAYLQSVLVSRISELGADPAVLGLLWELHSGAFAMSGIALGILLGSLSIGSLTVPIVPRWTAALGMVGAVLLLTSGAFSFNMIEGGPALFLGFGGFATWVVFVIVASLRMLRSTE